MRNYDATLILSPLTEEQQRNDIVQHLASFVQEKGGLLGEQHTKGKRPLLAPIGKNQEGYLATFAFTLAPEHLGDFEKACKEEKDMLRFLVAKQVKKRRKSRSAMAQKQTLAAPISRSGEPTEAESLRPVREEKTEKIDLKDIDKKLEEIFKEP